MKKQLHLFKILLITVSTLIPALAFAGLNNMSVKTMVTTYYDIESFDNFVGGTAFSLENNDESTEYDNFLFSEIFRRNASLSFNGYGEGSNGNFNGAGTDARQYAIVSNPKNLNSALVEKTDGVNRLVFHSAKQNAEFLTINISGYKLNTALKVQFTVEEVTGKSGATASWQVTDKKGEALGSAITIGGVVKLKKVTIDVPGDKTSEPDFTIVIKNNSANGANFVFAISRFAVFGTPDVPMTGVAISATDGGKELGNSVALSAIISEDGVTCDNIKWQRKDPGAGWSDMTQTGCDVKDIPVYAGRTSYRVQYTTATGEIKYSNEVEVKRISKCDGKASNNLFFEDFGVLSDEKDHAQCADVPSYSFAARCYPVKDGGQYAVVASGKWAGCDDVGRYDDGACNDKAKKYWFRDDLISHDGNRLGGMLLLNCQDGDKTDDVLYKRKVDLSCENTTVTFTFYIAQASKEASDPIKLLVELLNDNGEQVDDPVEIEDQLLPGADWKEFTMQFNTGTDKSVTIKVTNKAKAGAHGNDIFLDDLSFSICVPEAELNHKSGGVKRGKQVKADCGADVVLEVDATATAGIASPFYYWVVSENGGEYKYESSMSGETKKNNTFVPLEGKSFSTFVILAPSESVADKYFKGEGTDCQPVSATDTITVTCSIPSFTYTRECNDINFVAQVNPGDKVTLQHSTDGVAWNDIQTKTTSATQSSVQFSYTISKSESFRIKTVDDGGLETVTPAQAISFRNIEFSVSDKSDGTYGTSISIEQNESAFFKIIPDYEGEEDDKYELLYKDGISVKTVEPTTDAIEITDIQQSAFYMARYAGCESSVAEVKVKGTISIEKVYRKDCNTVGFKANTTESTVKWYVNGDFKDEKSSSEEFEWIMSESSEVYATIYDDTKESNHLTELHYTLPLLGKAGESAATQGPINVDAGSDVLIYLESTAFAGDGDVLYEFKDNVGTTVYSTYYSADMSYKAVNLQSADKFYVTTKDGCRSNEIDVKIKATISIEQTSVKCNNYGFKATITGDGSDIEWQKYYYSESKWSNIGTGMELKDFSISEDTRIRATYGGAISDTIDLVYHKLNLEAVPNHIFAGDEVLFTATTIPADWLEGKDITLYDTEDTDYGASSTHKWSLYPNKETNYVVKAEGCTSGRITVFIAERKITWPTIFMPYSTSGNNVLFAPFYEEGNPPYTYLNKTQIDEIKIFDRTGNMVADVKGDYWDGTSADGKLVMPGVYYYVGSLIDNDTTFKGHVEVYKEK